MRVSINRLFKNIKLLLIILSVMLGLLSFSMYQEYSSFQKLDKLELLKKHSTTIASLEYDDLDLSIIQFRGTYNIMKVELSRLQSLKDGDILGSMFFDYTPVYDQDLAILTSLAQELENSADAYFSNIRANLDKREAALQDALGEFHYQVNKMIIDNVSYEEKKFNIQLILSLGSFLIMLTMLLWYSRQLKRVYTDLESLFSVDLEGSSEREIYTEEVEAIAKRMGRKPSLADNPDLLDPVTEINNYKGLLQNYANQKGKNDNTFTTVCLFEIDYFRELDKKYSKEFTQTVLKKIAFIISLNQNHTDIIARCDYDQFCVVFSRNSKEEAYRDCETIRNSVADTSFKVPQGEVLQLTLSGGFVVKEGNKTLDQAIDLAKQIVVTAQENGRNRIAQLRDHAEQY